MSVTDIGSIKYTNSPNSQQYTLTAAGANTQDFAKQQPETYNDYFNRLKTDSLVLVKGAAPTSKVKPADGAAFQRRLQYYRRLYIDGDILLNMLATTNPVSPNYITTFTVTPRLEKKWVSIYSPVSYNANGQFNWGAGVRVGPLFVGSGSILSSMLKQRLQTADVHMGLTIPIFQTKSNKDKTPTLSDTVYRDKKIADDRDGDGVVDSKDQCLTARAPYRSSAAPMTTATAYPITATNVPV